MNATRLNQLKKTLLASAVTLGCINSAQASWSSWTNATMPYPNPVFTANQIMGNPPTGGSEYMWYCPAGTLCPTGSEGPSVAEFKLDVVLPATGQSGVTSAFARILADDYFALYVNGELADSCASIDASGCVGRTTHGAYAWLDDRADNPNVSTQLGGNPIYAKVPMWVDLKDYLHAGSNEILIAACDGYPPGTDATTRIPAGQTPADAFAGCPNPGPRGYQYALLEGSIDGWGLDQYHDYVNYSTRISSSNDGAGGDPWQARVVPEPADIALISLGLACIYASGRRRSV